MFPLRDDVPSEKTPYVNYSIIVICALVFLGQLQRGDVLVEQFGMVPARVTNPGVPIVVDRPTRVATPRGYVIAVQEHQLAPPAVAPKWTILTCIFLHGGWLHILGNMWFLWIFGDNVEDRFGHFGFAALYLASGVLASITHLAAGPGSTVPTIGASGAIAGVMGAYMVLYPHARVLALIPLGIFLYSMVVPAYVFLGVWFAIQFFQSVGSVSAESGGVAWWAHTGGFVVGAVVALLIKHSSAAPPSRKKDDQYTIYMGEDDL